MGITQITQPLKECLGCRRNPALPLDRLNHYRAGVVIDQVTHAIEVVELTMHDPARHRPETLGVLGLTTHTYGEESASVEGLAKRHDTLLVLTEVIKSPAPCQLQCRLVGLATRGAEVDLVGKGALYQCLGQLECRLIGIDVGKMPQRTALLGKCLGQYRVAMTQGVHRNAAGKIDIFAAFLIPQSTTFATHRYDLLGRVVRYHVPIEIGAARGVAHFGLHSW